MSVLRTIGRALAPLAAVVTTMVWEAGKWILKCMPGYVPPQPDQVVEDYVDAAETAAVAPAADQRILNIQALASAIYHGATPRDEWLLGLSERTMFWIEAQNDEMLLKTAQARIEDLQAHIAGQRSIKGLLAYDPATVAEYQRAVAMKAEPEPEIEYARRRWR